MGPRIGVVLLALAVGACGGPVNCAPCQDPAEVRQPLHVSLGRALQDGDSYRFCAEPLGCWTATALLPDPGPDSTAPPWPEGEPLCLVDVLPSQATCHVTGERGRWLPGKAARVVLEVRSRAAPWRDVTVTVQGLGTDRRTGRAGTDYEEERGECSCGDHVSAEVQLG